MIEILPGLAIGGVGDCRKPSEGWSVIHACKFPCHNARCGNPKRGERAYFSDEGPHELFLNIIDPPTPLFALEPFEDFLNFARREWDSGRKILIHCNRGESRAPSLALLFAAKVLKTFSEVSYDHAYDDLEELMPGQYKPGTGIEEWLRIHWADLRPRPLPYIRGTLPTKPSDRTVNSPEMDAMTEEEAVKLVRGSPIIHFGGFVTIEDKNHERIRPRPNILQVRIAEAYEWCLLNGVPPRLMTLKPRQVGSSTFTGHLCYHHARRYHVDGMIIGDEASRTEKVWQIFTEYAKTDIFPWKDSSVSYNTEKARFSYSDGTEGLWEHDTANDPKAGISGTRQVIWYTEPARYAKSGVRTDMKVITASLNSLAKVPHSLAVAESTAEGASGWFYENWSQAASLEDCRAGAFGNGWIKVFAAWFEFEEHRLERRPDTEKYYAGELTRREKRGVELYGWDAAQIAWRRSQIANECGGSESTFDQDFPENDVDCFLSSGRPRFDLDGMTRLEKQATVGHKLAEKGVLQKIDGRVQFVPMAGEGDAWLWLKQRPKHNRAYIAALDPCTGDQSRGAKDPDSHAGGIMMAGGVDYDSREEYPPELVAAIDVPLGCRWDASVIAERMAMLCEYFGFPMIVPETGNGLGVLVKLQEHGLNIYRRPKLDDENPGTVHEVLGWETNSSTRPVWVEAAADGVRKKEKGFNCCYSPAVKELRTFSINDRGRAEAKGGCHDDWVTFIGIALANIQFASVYRDVPISSRSSGHSSSWTSGAARSAFS